ncbi:MAG TPA: phytoene dehydrogenase, partial [Anaeromyxobacteraceae bacterium]|nr:phytoene dehydrogenase [Anaeromyxobacteraceae bacterium]
AAVLQTLLPAEFNASKAGRFLGEVRPSRVLLTLNLVVKQGALPPALGDNVFALRDPAGGDGLDNAVFLQVLPARREGGKKSPGEVVADERVVCASAFVPAADTGREAIQAAAARVREAVADAIPFFERHLLSESIPMLASPEGRPSVHPLYRVDAESTLGITGLPVRGPFKNLFFAGREVLPGLGVEGEFYAGIEAAGHVAAALGRKELLK